MLPLQWLDCSSTTVRWFGSAELSVVQCRPVILSIDTMARWRPLWAHFARDNDLEPSQFAGYLQQRDRPYLLVPKDFDAKYEGFCRLCGLNCYPYTPDQCTHLNSRNHVRRSGDAQHLQAPWCNPPDAVQINLVDEPDQTIEAPEAPEALLAIEAPEALAGHHPGGTGGNAGC